MQTTQFHLTRLRRVLKFLIPMLVVGLLSLIVISTASATGGTPSTFTVNSTGDDGDNNIGDRICATSGGVCTLRAALQEAVVDGDVINFSLPAHSAITLTSNLPKINPANTSNLAISITGPGANLLTIDGTGSYRIFYVNEGLISISGLKLTGGSGMMGSAVVLDLDISVPPYTQITLDGMDITGNHASMVGGGVYNYNGIVNINSSAITDNSAGYYGGGVTNYSSISTVNITNSTISGNDAGDYGGGLYSPDGHVTLKHATITDNTSDSDSDGSGYGGGILGSPNVVLYSSIVYGNHDNNPTPKADCGTWDASGVTSMSEQYNITGDGTGCPHDQTGDTTENPNLEALANNGGPTQTHALSAGSSAIDRVPLGSNGCGTAPLDKDQRGDQRPFPAGGACDSGAFEASNEAPVAVDDSIDAAQGVAKTINVLANDTDADLDTLTVTNIIDPAHGTAILNGDNTITYTSDAGYTGSDSFTYTANDGTVDSNVATVTINVLAPNWPTSLKPVDGYGVKVGKNTQVLSWKVPTGRKSKEILNYQLQVATDAAFTAPLFLDKVTKSTKFTVKGLLPDTTYYWQVRANFRSGTVGSWSTVNASTSFHTQMTKAPALAAPKNNSPQKKDAVKLIWKRPAGAPVTTAYLLQVCKDATFATCAELQVTGTSRTFTAADFPITPTMTDIYYWHVMATNADWTKDYSLYSASRSFKR